MAVGSSPSVVDKFKPARAWFVTNAGVMAEWFGRVYPSAMAVAFHSGAYSQVIRFMWSALPELEKRKAKNGETAAPPLALITAAWGVRAMAEIGDAASIDGIESWAQRMYPDERWAWVEGAKRLAEGRFEDAIAILQRESIGRNFSETLTQSVQALLVSALSRIRESITLTKVNLDEEAMTKCRHLTQFSKIEKVAPPSAQSTPSWDLAKGLHATELWLMSTIKKSQVSECRRDVGLEGAATLMWDEDGIVASRYASLSLLASSLALRMDKGPHWANTHCSSLVVPSLASQLVDGPEALALARQQLGWTTRLGMCPPQMAAHLATAKLARATCNSLTMLAHLEHVTMNGGGQMHLVLTTQLQKSKLALATRSPSDWSKEKWKMVPAIADAFEVHARLKMEEAISGVQCQTEEAALVEVMSRCCLRLASWVGEEERIGVHVPMSRLHHDLEARRGETSLDEKGALLHLAVSLSPALAKAYRSFADHVLSLAESGRSTEERARQILSMEVGPDEAEPIVRAMRESTTLAQLEANLLKSAMYYDIPTLVNDVVAGVWADMQGRRALLFTQAIDGHFQFLRLAGATEGKSSSSVGVVSSTLRILHVLTRYAALYGLEGAIEGGLAVCDEALWKEILPQLFARLSHPLKSVRAIIVKLLARIGESSPHAIVYQAIVGAKSADLGGDLVDVEEAEEEAGPSSKQRSTVFDCCRQLERSLEAHSPRLVAQVKAFVRELQKLNLTDEKWSYVLTHLDMDMARRLRHVRGEKERTRLMVHIPEARKRAIVREKAEIILGPVFRILSDLLARTKAAAAAGLEDAKRFLTLYDGEIRAAFAERPMREDLMEDDEEEARWIPFKKLCASVASRTSRRGGHSIDIGLVAKGLYKCEEGGWDVPLPGQEDLALENVVRMRSVCHQAIVLATKTRPKKLTLMTTEGREVVYLFKGHEDLHLDERIMQLLHMCNLMLGSRSKREWPAYTARNYAVTPLGTLSGLIQWVEGATPVYQIYRKWQQREAYKTPLNGKPTALPDVIALKPIELYHKRLKELFETNNLDSRSMSSRRNWPSEILLELFTGLLDETPKDLISRELWLRSRSSAHWMRTTATFARSTAVMGMIGSLLGLGDRHLDNLLLDLDGAHLVHIDYNVCFDKGRVLKVPETVPFRLTQNIVHALGPTQIDGVFSTSCASVLESLRSHSSLFSFLLDAFLYDPLVDWTSQRDALSSNVAAAVTLLVYGDEVKAEEDRPLAKRLFCLRIDELRELLCRGRDDIFAILTAWRSTVISGLRPALSPDDALALHMKLWQDLRPLLKNIATKDEVFAAYCADYRRHVTETIATFASICNDPTSNALELLPLLDQMEVAIPRAYDSLFGLEARAKASGGATGGNKVAAVSAPPGFEDMAPVASSEGTNALAAFTVRQIIDKVEGRVDPCDRSRIVPPAEYASTLISSASSLSSLSLMYEGWTAWV